MALSVGPPRGTHSRYVIGCCLIPLEICGVKNNSRRITYGIGGCPLCPLYSLLYSAILIKPGGYHSNEFSFSNIFTWYNFLSPFYLTDDRKFCQCDFGYFCHVNSKFSEIV